MSRTTHSRTIARVDPGPPSRPWSPVRVAGAIVIAAWAALFWFLLLSGRDAFYLSTRTEWVVPVAAVILTAAALGRLVSARAPRPEAIRRRELGVMAAMVAPVLLVLALPPATLGTFSADKRSGFVGAGVPASAVDIGSGELTLIDVAAGQTSPEGERALARRAGETVDFIGIVTRYEDTPADEFLLTRYVVTCCVADATVAQIRVVNVTPGAFEDNEWVEVVGAIYPLGREVIVNASTVASVARPERPYLSA
ncbi:MAG: TIGR03943 family putative permease subunit [Actinomycetota bacterium]